MSARKALPLLAGLVVAALVLALALPAFGQTGIIVNNADATRTTSTSLAPDLNIRLNQASLRIVTQYSNALRYFGLISPPAALQSRLGLVAERVVFDHAASSRTVLLPAVPVGLQTLLGQAALRVIFDHAASARQQPLAYPRDLLADSVPPVISGVAAARDVDGMKITWTTDEFADSTVLFGTQPGAYPQTASDPLYVKNHVVLLPGLAEGTYYYRVQSRDQSGNLVQSTERSFTVTAGPIPWIYLPYVRR